MLSNSGLILVRLCPGYRNFMPERQQRARPVVRCGQEQHHFQLGKLLRKRQFERQSAASSNFDLRKERLMTAG